MYTKMNINDMSGVREDEHVCTRHTHEKYDARSLWHSVVSSSMVDVKAATVARKDAIPCISVEAIRVYRHIRAIFFFYRLRVCLFLRVCMVVSLLVGSSIYGRNDSCRTTFDSI